MTTHYFENVLLSPLSEVSRLRAVTCEARKRSLSNYQAYLELPSCCGAATLAKGVEFFAPKLTISEMAQAIASEG
jgi:hypothetical protein